MHFSRIQDKPVSILRKFKSDLEKKTNTLSGACASLSLLKAASKIEAESVPQCLMLHRPCVQMHRGMWAGQQCVCSYTSFFNYFMFTYHLKCRRDGKKKNLGRNANSISFAFALLQGKGWKAATAISRCDSLFLSPEFICHHFVPHNPFIHTHSLTHTNTRTPTLTHFKGTSVTSMSLVQSSLQSQRPGCFVGCREAGLLLDFCRSHPLPRGSSTPSYVMSIRLQCCFPKNMQK